MSVKTRPGFQVNVDSTSKSTESKSVFLDIKPGTKHQLRFLPPSNKEGLLFFESAQHFNFTEEGNKRAWACLRVHGEKGQQCPICQIVEAAEETGDEKYKKLIDKHKVALRWHAQVVPLPRDGQPVEQLYVVGLSKQTAEKVSKILKMERDNRQPLLTDPDNGQAIQIERNDKSGLQTRYEVMATGLRVGLDDIYSNWTEEFLDVEKALKLRVATPETLQASIEETISKVLLKDLQA